MSRAEQNSGYLPTTAAAGLSDNTTHTTPPTANTPPIQRGSVDNSSNNLYRGDRGSDNSSNNLTYNSRYATDSATNLEAHQVGLDSKRNSQSFTFGGSRRGSVFGVPPWPVSQKYPKKFLKEEKITEIEPGAVESISLCSVGNILWVILFGWWISLFFFVASGLLMITFVARDYARSILQFAIYIVWPFGKCVVQLTGDSDFLLSESRTLILKQKNSLSRGDRFSYVVYMIICSVVLFPILLIAVMFNWFFVVSIPMAKVLWTILDILIHKPKQVAVLPDYSRAASFSVLLCNFRAFNVLYFEYEFKGVNIVFLNLIPVVIARAIMIVVHLFHHYTLFEPITQFFINLLCSIPITFYIGTSIASIAMQTNYTIGAILNASFGSITELMLFTFAIRKGALNDLILYSLTGSLLCDMLLLPGISMIVGGIRFHEQKFNPTAASVSSLLLFVAIIGAFTPTIWYHVFGVTSSDCVTCIIENGTDLYNGTRMFCFDCSSGSWGLGHTDDAAASVKKLSYLACAVLPFTYLIGLFFTFKTHKHIFDEEGEEEGSAEWSIPFSIFVMLVSITCFGLLAEDVVEILENVLVELGLTQAFVGITLIALTPAATEIANAIKFALLNQISLSVSIGSASSIQVALIQMPALMLLAIAFSADETFHLIFPLMSVFSVILSVITFNYISAEGHSNYFIGSVLVVMYVLLIASFFFTPGEHHFPPFLQNRTDLIPVSPSPPPPHIQSIDLK